MRQLIAGWQGRRGGLWLVALGLVSVVLVMALAEGGLTARLLLWQRELHRGLTLAMTQLSAAPSAATWIILLGASFGYGVFHAAGPGHGKAVLSTYLLSQGGAMGRALLLSVAASLLQAMVAIALIAMLVHGLGWLTREAMDSVAWVEQASFALVTVLGLWLCLRAVRHWRSVLSPAAPGNDARRYGSGACGCGHEHHVAPSWMGSWRTALVTVMAIGLRPCSGGVLVLGAASLLGQFWAGVAAVLVMAAGTALAVSGLALISVLARGWAERRLTATHSRILGGRRLLSAIALAGGVAITLLGLSLSVAGWVNDDAPLLIPPAATDTSHSPFGRQAAAG